MTNQEFILASAYAGRVGKLRGNILCAKCMLNVCETQSWPVKEALRILTEALDEDDALAEAMYSKPELPETSLASQHCS
jgi:hypothetical protein